MFLWIIFCFERMYLGVVQKHDVRAQPDPGYVGVTVGGREGVQAGSLAVAGRQGRDILISDIPYTLVNRKGAEVKEAVGSRNVDIFQAIIGVVLQAIILRMWSVDYDVGWWSPGS